MPRDTVVRRLTREPLGHRPTVLLVRVRRYHTPLGEAYVANLTRPYHEQLGALGMKLQDMLADDLLTPNDISEFGDIVDGRAPGCDHERVSFFSIGGISAEDIAWATEPPWGAKPRSIGTALPIWDQPTLI